jgi:hypothetical protein
MMHTYEKIIEAVSIVSGGRLSREEIIEISKTLYVDFLPDEAVAKPLLGDGWWDAKKEVPEYKFIMLVFCDGCGDVDYYSFGRYEDGRWIDKFDSCVLDVIAWRPLPDPPAFA